MGSKKYKYPFWYMKEFEKSLFKYPTIVIARMVDDKGTRFMCDFYLRVDKNFIEMDSQMDVEKYTHSYGEGPSIGYNNKIVRKAIKYIFKSKSAK